MIFSYVRDRKRRKIGVVCAVDSHMVGWSACKKGDRFSPTKGLEIAEGRALNGSNANPPRSFSVDIDNMHDRSVRYFK
jgi:hypothetical protein